MIFNENGEVVAAHFAERVKIGMTKEAVLRLMGEPAASLSDRAVLVLHYSWPGESGSHEARIIGLDGENRVSGIYKYRTYE